MSHKYQETASKAHDHLKKRDFSTAGDLYSFSAYSALGKSEYTATMILGSSMYFYLSASLCYRLAGNLKRCQNRCRQGILISEELRENVWEENVRIGLTYELTGDFQIIGNLSGSETSYENALSHYVDCENPFGWMGEPEFELPMMFFLRLTESMDYDIDSETVSMIRDNSLVERIQYKQKHYPMVIEQVLDQGYFEY